MAVSDGLSLRFKQVNKSFTAQRRSEGFSVIIGTPLVNQNLDIHAWVRIGVEDLCIKFNASS